MGYRHALLALSLALLGSLTPACGKQIGDACQISSDCASDGTRICDLPSQSPGGYCTIQGCDYSTCPDEAVCVRFFPGGGTGAACNPKDPTTDDECTLDEVCSLAGAPTVTVDDAHPLDSQGSCVLRSSEVRYCMKQCDSNDDCRDGYECRDLAKMKDHGGEPVLAPGKAVDASAPKFCAIAP